MLRVAAQGDRRAGPSLQGFHIDSMWGQRALKQVYAAIMEVPPSLGHSMALTCSSTCFMKLGCRHVCRCSGRVLLPPLPSLQTAAL